MLSLLFHNAFASPTFYSGLLKARSFLKVRWNKYLKDLDERLLTFYCCCRNMGQYKTLIAFLELFRGSQLGLNGSQFRSSQL